MADVRCTVSIARREADTDLLGTTNQGLSSGPTDGAVLCQEYVVTTVMTVS